MQVPEQHVHKHDVLAERLIAVRSLTVEQQVWLAAWCAVASDWRVTDHRAPATWADAALEQFRERFGDSNASS